MSRFEMNKVILWMDEDADRVADFHRDPSTWIDEWDRRGRSSRLPLPDAGRLADEEKRAFADRDYGRLYELGAHPYLLLHFARALDVVLDGTPWPEFVARYKEATKPVPYSTRSDACSMNSTCRLI